MRWEWGRGAEAEAPPRVGEAGKSMEFANLERSVTTRKSGALRLGVELKACQTVPNRCARRMGMEEVEGEEALLRRAHVVDCVRYSQLVSSSCPRPSVQGRRARLVKSENDSQPTIQRSNMIKT